MPDININAAKLSRLDPIDRDGKFGLVVCVSGREEREIWYDDQAERERAQADLLQQWRDAREIKGVRPDGETE